MIIFSESEVEPVFGKVYQLRIYDQNLEEHRYVPTTFIRKATYEEYIEYCKVMGCDDLVKICDVSKCKFYEAITD